MDRDLLTQYEDGGRKLQRAVDHLDRNDFVAVPIPGKWSIQQLVVHVADTEQVLADRIKRLIAEDEPTLQDFDENKWMAGLSYDLRSAEDAVAMVTLTRRSITEILRLQPDEAFARAGTHTALGKVTLEQVVRKAVGHLDHHLKFLYAKREAMGKNLW